MNGPPSSFPVEGRILVAVPHMDDEVLGAGGLLAALPDKSRVRFFYATRGSSAGANEPEKRADLRRRESLDAIARLGYAEDQAVFLDIPDYETRRQTLRLKARLADLVDRWEPDWFWTPFRFDRHPDHVELSRVVRDLAARRAGAKVLEYFVYYRWKLLPGGDVRRAIKPELLWQADIREQSALKRAALECFVSQTTTFEPGQKRPVLSKALLDEVSAGPEVFLHAPPGTPDAALFTVPLPLIRLVHGIEPALKRLKDRLL